MTGIRPKSNHHEQLKTHQYEQAKKMIISITYSAFLFFIIFISITSFNISPSILFKDTKFWFFISNAIVVIIVIDSGAFSSSKEGHYDLYEEVIMNRKAKNTTTTTSFQSPTKYDLEKKPMILLESEMSIPDDKPMIFHKTSLEAHDHKGNMQNIEKEIEFGDKDYIEAHRGKRSTPRYYRSNSQRMITVVPNDDKRILGRSKTKKYEEKLEEDDEFSVMSDEELNKRVEEFIERFNRQIRLQESTI